MMNEKRVAIVEYDINWVGPERGGVEQTAGSIRVSESF
jgi:hypothetical protein